MNIYLVVEVREVSQIVNLLVVTSDFLVARLPEKSNTISAAGWGLDTGLEVQLVSQLRGGIQGVLKSIQISIAENYPIDPRCN